MIPDIFFYDDYLMLFEKKQKKLLTFIVTKIIVDLRNSRRYCLH